MATTTTTTTGWNGKYLFPQLDPGSYTITVSKSTYNGSTSFATILTDEITRADLSLTSSPVAGNTAACAGTSSKTLATAGDLLLQIAFPSVVGVLALLKTV